MELDRTEPLVVLIVILCLSTVSSSASSGNCCGMDLMDTSGRVILETQSPLSLGSYMALKIQTCTENPFAVQIWRLLNSSTFQFRWQTVITGNNQLGTTLTVNFNSPLTINSDDRLGFFTLANSSQLPIPYVEAEVGFYLQNSVSSFNDYTDFTSTSSVEMNIDDFKWPRSFIESTILCQSIDCDDIVDDSPLIAGPPTTSIPSNQCCPNKQTCDASSLVQPISNQGNDLQNLTQQVNDIEVLINILASKGGMVTGLCQPGFTSGIYGIGKCYVLLSNTLPMAEAIFQCQSMSASLVHISSILEDNFLADFITSNAGGTSMRFWTAAWYDIDTMNWSWFDDQLIPTLPFTNWQNGVTPIPTGPNNICSLMVVDKTTGQNYWTNTDCSDQNQYICERMKVCF